MASASWPFSTSAIAQLEVIAGHHRVEIDGRAEGAGRAGHVPFGPQRKAEVLLRRGVARVQLDRALVGADRAFEVALGHQARCQGSGA